MGAHIQQFCKAYIEKAHPSIVWSGSRLSANKPSTTYTRQKKCNNELCFNGPFSTMMFKVHKKQTMLHRCKLHAQAMVLRESL